MTRTSRRAWFLVGLLWFVSLLNCVDRQVIFFLFPPVKAELHLSDVQLGLLGTAFLWIYGLISPLAGFLSDKYSRRGIVVFSLFVWSAVTWATGHVTTFTALLFTRGLMGISEACYFPAALALIADHHGPATRSRAVGLHQTGWYFGIAFGGVAGGWIGQHYGWRSVFILLGLAGIAYSFLLHFFLPGKHSVSAKAGAISRPKFGSSIQELLRTRRFVVLCCVNAVQSIGWWIVYTWLPLYLYEQFRLSLAEAGLTATLYLQSAGFAGIAAGGWLADKWSQTTDRSRIFTQAIGLVLAGPCLGFVGWTDSISLLIAALIIAGVGRGAYDCNTMPVMCQFTRPEIRATGYGVYNWTSCVLSGTMMAVAGALKETLGLGFALQASGALILACGLFMFTVRVGSEPCIGGLPVAQPS